MLAAYRLKDETRTGWVLREVDGPESVADHSWGTAFLCLLFADLEEVDPGRCLAIATVHDLAEAETGDIPARVHDSERSRTPEQKRSAEDAAMESFKAGLAGIPREQTGPEDGAAERVYRLWKEYEEAESKEAVFVRDMNLIDMCLQALFYERNRRYVESPGNPNFKHFQGLDEFFATSEPRIRTEIGRSLYLAVRSEYETSRRDKS